MEFLMGMMDYLLIKTKRFSISIRKILTIINIFYRSFSLKCLVYICDPIIPYEKKNERSNRISCFCFSQERTNQPINLIGIF